MNATEARKATLVVLEKVEYWIHPSVVNCNLA